MNIKRLLSVVCLLTVLAFNGRLTAQTIAHSVGQNADTLSHKLVHQIGLDIRAAYVTPTSDFFQGYNSRQKEINSSFSAHLKYAFRFGKDTYWGRLYPHAYQGIGIAYNTFFSSSELGNPVMLYAFQGSRIKQFSPRLSLDYEWNFGASFGWEKYHPEYHPMNKVIGSKINAYINLGFLLNWRLLPQWNLVAGVDFTHFSNGNTHYPNAGVNPIGGRIGIVHTLGKPEDESWGPASPGPYNVKPYICYDLVVYGATRKRGFTIDGTPYLVPGSFGIVGLNFGPMYHFNKYFKAGVSMDAQYDESANIKEYKLDGGSSDNPKFHRPPFRKQFAVGLSLRGELVMPIFSVNIGVGRNMIYSGEDTKGFYQILVLKTFITRRLFLHTGYQLSKFKDPNNLMLGIGYRFNGR